MRKFRKQHLLIIISKCYHNEKVRCNHRSQCTPKRTEYCIFLQMSMLCLCRTVGLLEGVCVAMPGSYLSCCCAQATSISTESDMLYLSSGLWLAEQVEN